MFDLKDELIAWREAMRLGGIRAGTVRDELESHLCEEFQQQARLGVEGKVAFLRAVAKLGQPEAIEEQFRADSRWSRFKEEMTRSRPLVRGGLPSLRMPALPTDRLRTILLRNFALYPAISRRLAWPALILCPVLIFRWVWHAWHFHALPPGLSGFNWYQLIIWNTFPSLLAVMGLTAAVEFLRGKRDRQPRQLAGFWAGFICWLAIDAALRFQGPNGYVVPDWWPLAVMATGIMAYFDWVRRISASEGGRVAE